MSAGRDDADVPVPGIGRLAWLMFMQPVTLRKLLSTWGLEAESSLWPPKGWLSKAAARRLLGRLLATVTLVMPLVVLVAAAVLSRFVPMSWPSVIEGVVVGVVLGVVAGMVFDVVFGVVLGVMIGVVLSLAMGVGAAEGVVFGIVLGAVLGVASGTSGELVFFGGGGVVAGLLGAALGLAELVSFGWASAVALGLGLSVAYGLAFFRLPFFLMASAYTSVTAVLARGPQRSEAAARWLPHRHHDLIHFPLPGLAAILVEIGTHHPSLARELIDEAAASLGQARPARRALDELQARTLELAAREQDWDRVVDLDSPFFPAREDLEADDPLQRFVAPAKDLRAAQSGSQHRRRRLLDSAARHLDALRVSIVRKGDEQPTLRRLIVASQPWTEAVERRREQLSKEIQQNPEVPAAFVAGRVLNPKDPEEVELFRVRRDLIDFIEQDLGEGRRGSLLLTGQRRMGKSSLLQMLPLHLGTATTVALCNFQRLSDDLERPAHRRVVDALAKALAEREDLLQIRDLPPTDGVGQAWSAALDWLEQVDAELGRVDHRALIAIDEVEMLQRGVDEGWARLDFLDFVRTAGDTLIHVRLLLVSAHLLVSRRLGEQWVSRLISVRDCRLRPFARDEAEQLLRKPVSDFPDSVFDDDAVRTVLAQTGTHPYLIQAVGLEVVNRLFADDRKQASARDIRFALDHVAGDKLFGDLWSDLETDERAILGQLARGEAVEPGSATLENLRRQDYVEQVDGAPALTFPLFGRWIRTEG